MIKKSNLVLSAIVIMMFTVISCDSDRIGYKPSEANSDANGPSKPAHSLTATSWTLVAFVDVANNVSREPNYSFPDWSAVPEKDSLYTLLFVNDTLMRGRQVTNRFEGRYTVESCGENVCLIMAEVRTTLLGGDLEDGFEFSGILSGLLGPIYFERYAQILHIFYNDGKNYLKFKKI